MGGEGLLRSGVQTNYGEACAMWVLATKSLMLSASVWVLVTLILCTTSSPGMQTTLISRLRKWAIVSQTVDPIQTKAIPSLRINSVLTEAITSDMSSVVGSAATSAPTPLTFTNNQESGGQGFSSSTLT